MQIILQNFVKSAYPVSNMMEAQPGLAPEKVENPGGSGENHGLCLWTADGCDIINHKFDPKKFFPYPNDYP